MNYIVLDLEWNQSTTGKNKEVKTLPFEIIEIGAVKLDENFHMIDKFQGVIKPSVYTHINYISQGITGFTYSELKKGESFPKVFQRFLSWCGDDFVFCTWGPLDVAELQRNMHYYKIPLFKPPVFFYDIQEIFCIVNNEDGNLRRSLEYVVDFYQIAKGENFHRALSDAYYTALVMAFFDKDIVKKHICIDTYQKPQSVKDEIYVVYDDCSQYVSKVFPSKTEVLKDNNVSSTRCYRCNKKLRKKIRWFSDNSKTYYCLAQCPEHGFLQGKLRIKKTEDEKYFALKELKPTDEDGALNMFNRKQESVKKKRFKRLHSEQIHNQN